jgi:diguanylate cyclase (GGDEF)-like protein
MRDKDKTKKQLIEELEFIRQQVDKHKSSETKYKQLEEVLAKRVRLATLGADVGIALTMGITLRSMLQRCSESMVQNLGATFARIWTFNEKGYVLELQASAGIYTHIDGSHSRVPVGKFKIGLIAQEHKPHLTNDVLNDPRISDPEWAKREGVVAFAGHPLIVEGKLVGVMAMFACEPLTEDTIYALASVADEIALGIDRKRSEEIIEYMAYHDSLTGLPNRNLLKDRFAIYIAMVHRRKEMMAVMFLDLDSFKEVNDTLGHTMGDKLLKVMTERLKGALRGEDTVARVGGDEFVILLPQIASGEGAIVLAQKILEVIRKPLMLDGHELLTTTSIGIALYPDDGEDAETLMKKADVAMYRAKEEGRNNYQFYTPES